MRLTAATIAAILSTLPANALGQCSEEDAKRPCVLRLFETAKILDGKNKVAQLKLGRCLAKLEVRTSTAISRFVVPDVTPDPGVSPSDWITITIGAGAAGLIIGALFGIAIH